jgi:hypothetical protein
MMEKFGVDEDLSKEKKASGEVTHCPECGSELAPHGKLVLCPVHGSKPFESPNERSIK